MNTTIEKDVADNLAKVKAAIAQAAKDFSQAYVDGDIDKLMSFYTADAAILPGNLDIIDNRDSIRGLWVLRPGLDILSHKSTSKRLEIEGDMASDYGYYEGQSVMEGKEPQNFFGKYVIVWKKEADGQWRMAVDMWSGVRRD